MIFNRIYSTLMQLIPDLLSLEIGEHRKSSPAKIFMPLNLDVLDKNESEITIALSHYYKHSSGDMIADPDMEIRVIPSMGAAEALSYQDYFGYRTVYLDEAKTLVNIRTKNELNRFLEAWLTNIRHQGHDLTGLEPCASENPEEPRP